jgi:NAD(P)-dependent dehydrogenase (short-subunit alcohol dehydrogenase family)
VSIGQFGGRVAVITGGASGIGLGLARSLLRKGARVALADNRADAIGAALAELNEHGDSVAGFEVDVSDLDQMRALADRVFERFGAAHILCNNAGITMPGRLWALTDAQWDRILGVNLHGVINGIRAFVPRMIEQGQGGHVVNTSSLSGLFSVAGSGGYAITKHAVVAVSETLALDFAELSIPIGVSVYLPGIVMTNIMNAEREDAAQSAALDNILLERRRKIGANGGLRADEAGEVVTAAIAENRFWIFNDDGSLDVIRKRFRSVAALENPRLRR